MPLSDHEQRVLEQMEQALYAEDPRLASHLGRAERGAGRRRAILGVLIAILGLGLVVLGVTIAQIWIGGIGFGAMVLGGVLAFAPARGSGARLGTVKDDGSVATHQAAGKHGGKRGKPGPSGGTGKGGKPKGGFMSRMEQKWDQRREDGPF